MTETVKDKIARLKKLIAGTVVFIAGTSVSPATAAVSGTVKANKASKNTVAVNTGRFAKYKSAENEIISTLLFYEGCVDKAYKCEAGVRTVAIGNTKLPDGSPIPAGYTVKSKKELTDLVVSHLEREIYPALDTYIKRPLRDGELVALVSLCYNCGTGVLGKNGKPSMLAKGVNARSNGIVEREFMKYMFITKRNKKTRKTRKVLSNGLGVRRCGEMYTYLGLISPDDVQSFFIGGQKGLNLRSLTTKTKSGRYMLKKDAKTIRKFKENCCTKPNPEDMDKVAWFGGNKTVQAYLAEMSKTYYAFASKVMKKDSHNM